MTKAYEMWTGFLYDFLNRKTQMEYILATKKLPGHKKNSLRKKVKMVTDCSYDLSSLFMTFNTCSHEEFDKLYGTVIAEWENRFEQIYNLSSDKVNYTRGYRRRMRKLADFCSYMLDTIAIFYSNLFIDKIVDGLDQLYGT